jgi:hypothetical protein
MIRRLCFIILTLTLIAIACSPVTFTEPQPKDVAAISSFPKRVQGNYLSAEDSSLLTITANSVIKTYDFLQKVHVSQLDSTMQIIGDSLFDLDTNTGQLIQVEGDSIVMRFHEVDTLFAINQQNILKKFKGYYFLNISYTADSWQVKKLEFSHSKVILNSINTKEDFEQLKEITENKQDTLPYTFSPTRRQFKKFVRNEGFRDSEEFLKLRN